MFLIYYVPTTVSRKKNVFFLLSLKILYQKERFAGFLPNYTPNITQTSISSIIWLACVDKRSENILLLLLVCSD